MRPQKSLLQCGAYPFPMGVTLGLSLVPCSGLFDAFHVRDLVAKAAHLSDHLMLVTTYGPDVRHPVGAT